MKKVGFIGAYDKIDMILYTAKILTMLGNKVLVIDSTIMQKAKYIVPSINPTVSYITTFEDIDVAIGFEDYGQIKKYLRVASEEEMPYDIALIDTDKNETLEKLDFYENDKNFFVTSFDGYSIKRGLEILNGLQIPLELNKVLFSMNTYEEDNSYLDFLSLEKKIRWDDFRIYFPLSNEDLNANIENQKSQKMIFKRLSTQYKEGLVYVVQEIEPDINEQGIRKIVRILEKGV